MITHSGDDRSWWQDYRIRFRHGILRTESSGKPAVFFSIGHFAVNVCEESPIPQWLIAVSSKRITYGDKR